MKGAGIAAVCLAGLVLPSVGSTADLRPARRYDLEASFLPQSGLEASVQFWVDSLRKGSPSSEEVLKADAQRIAADYSKGISITGEAVFAVGEWGAYVEQNRISLGGTTIEESRPKFIELYREGVTVCATLFQVRKGNFRDCLPCLADEFVLGSWQNPRAELIRDEAVIQEYRLTAEDPALESQVMVVVWETPERKALAKVEGYRESPLTSERTLDFVYAGIKGAWKEGAWATESCSRATIFRGQVLVQERFQFKSVSEIDVSFAALPIKKGQTMVDLRPGMEDQVSFQWTGDLISTDKARAQGDGGVGPSDQRYVPFLLGVALLLVGPAWRRRNSRPA